MLDDWFSAAGRGGKSADKKKCECLLDEHKGKLDINQSDSVSSVKSGYTALGIAVVFGHADVIDLLLRRGANVNKLNSHSQYRPAWLAALYNRVELLAQLLAAGANVNEVCDVHRAYPTALHVASFFGHSEVVRALLKAGADVAIRNKQGKTAADLAAEQKQHGVLAVLKEFGISLPSVGERNPSMRVLQFI